MAWCFYNPEKAKELGRRARANVVKRFSNEAVAELIMNRLKDIRKILDAEDSGENKMEVEEEGKRKASLSTAFQWYENRLEREGEWKDHFCVAQKKNESCKRFSLIF